MLCQQQAPTSLAHRAQIRSTLTPCLHERRLARQTYLRGKHGAHVVEHDIHGRDESALHAFAPREHVSADAAFAIVDNPGSRVACVC